MTDDDDYISHDFVSACVHWSRPSSLVPHERGRKLLQGKSMPFIIIIHLAGHCCNCCRLSLPIERSSPSLFRRGSCPLLVLGGRDLAPCACMSNAFNPLHPSTSKMINTKLQERKVGPISQKQKRNTRKKAGSITSLSRVIPLHLFFPSWNPIITVIIRAFRLQPQSENDRLDRSVWRGMTTARCRGRIAVPRCLVWGRASKKVGRAGTRVQCKVGGESTVRAPPPY